MIACICGGTLETWLILVGLGCLCGFIKKKHNKKKCNCCKEYEKKIKEECKDIET